LEKLKKIGWADHSENKIRQQFWCESLKLPIQWIDLTAELSLSAPEILKLKSVDGLLVDPELSADLIAASSRVPTEIVESGLVDSLVFDGRNLWIRCYLRESLRRSILGRAPRLDTHSLCYVTGSQALARMGASVAIQMGFRRVAMISESSEDLEVFVERLRRVFFGIDLRILKETELTLQPNNGSLLINTIPADSGSLVFEDLTYLNFLQKQGLVVDLPFSARTNPLLEEARHTHVLELESSAVWGLRDYLFLQGILGKEIQISETDYLSRWLDHLFEKRT
jgi:hypothetical protein